MTRSNGQSDAISFPEESKQNPSEKELPVSSEQSKAESYNNVKQTPKPKKTRHSGKPKPVSESQTILSITQPDLHLNKPESGIITGDTSTPSENSKQLSSTPTLDAKDKAQTNTPSDTSSKDSPSFVQQLKNFTNETSGLATWIQTLLALSSVFSFLSLLIAYYGVSIAVILLVLSLILLRITLGAAYLLYRYGRTTVLASLLSVILLVIISLLFLTYMNVGAPVKDALIMGTPKVTQKSDGSLEIRGVWEEAFILGQNAPTDFRLTMIIQTKDEINIGFAPISITTKFSDTTLPVASADAYVVTIKPFFDPSIDDDPIIRFRRWKNREDRVEWSFPIPPSAIEYHHVLFERRNNVIEIIFDNQRVSRPLPVEIDATYSSVFISTHPIPGRGNTRDGIVLVKEYKIIDLGHP